MDTEEVGQIAVKVATKGENEGIGKTKYVCNWKEFGKFVGVWFITAIVLFSALLIITVVRGSKDIIYDTIQEVDTINMMFSLVLSALFEQIWSKKGSSWLYNITLGAEMAMAFIGCMLFLTYSIIQIFPDNQLVMMAFEVNIGYIIMSTVVILLGFYSRAIYEAI